MASRDKALAWRGDVRALVGLDDGLLVFTTHPEGQPSAVWRIDADKATLAGERALGTGAAAALVADDTLYVAGTDGRLLSGPLTGGRFEAIGEPHAPAPTALAALDGDRLAALCGAEVRIVHRQKGTLLGTLPLPADGTALAASTDGRRLVAGTAKGEVAVFGPAGDDPGAELLAGACEKLHDGPVTALTFDRDGAVFTSSGADLKLLRGHARGAIEPEDRAGRNMHGGPICGFVHRGEGAEHRLYTAGADGAIKCWLPGKKRPRTWKDGVRRPTAMAALTLRGRPHLAVSGDDGAIRVFLLDADGQVVDKPLTLRDAYAAARNAFGDRQPSARQKAIDTIAGYDDGPAIALLLDRAQYDDDAGLRVRAVEALGAAQNARARQPLEQLLRNNRDAVRLAALAALRSRLGAADRQPMELALQTGSSDIGVAAVEALAGLAGDDDQAYAMLVGALDHREAEVRAAAFAALDAHHPAESPEASLLGLASNAADMRVAALLRFYHREQLQTPRAATAVRRAGEDGDADVRVTAFRVSLLARPTLAAALRYVDRDLHRQLHQIEKPGAEKLPKAKKVAAAKVDEADRRPLLEAMASRALSTCLLGAVGLARLGDGRAFGTLLQLTRESSEGVRVEACKSLAELGDPRGVGRLRMMLHDGSASVRDAAFDALAGLLSKAPLDAAEAGLMAPFEDVRRRALQHLIAHIKGGPRAKGKPKNPPKSADAPSAALLRRALNDPASGVRGEAFKAIVNLELFGGGGDALRFTLGSLSAAVRREALNEVMGEIARPWAAELLLELFDDPDAGLRREAFDFARKRAKGRDVTPLARALGCRHVDLRLEAARTLARKGKGADARALLVAALDDDDRQVRITAIDALEAAEAHDAVAGAMASAHADVRIRAAESRAADADPAALEPLLAQVRSETSKVDPGEWTDLTRRALRGLAELADPAAVPALIPLLDADDGDIRRGAADALGWSVSASDPAPLEDALRHSDGAVRLSAAMALARLGNPVGAAILFAPPPEPSRGRRRRATRRGSASSSDSGPALGTLFGVQPGSRDDTPAPSDAQALEAAVALGARDAVQVFLDRRDPISRRALRILLLQEAAERPASPERCLAALSARSGRVRLTAADALSRYAAADAFAAFVAERLGERDGQLPRAVEQAADLGRLLAFGPPRLRARAVQLVGALEASEEHVFDRAWRRFEQRFADALTGLRAAERPAAKPAWTADALQALVFGAYVGLSRLEGGQAEARIRTTAVSRLVAAGAPIEQMVPVLVPALSDRAADVRLGAFAGLKSLGFDPTRLAAEALASGRRDVAVAGLTLLADEAGAAGDTVLGEVIDHDTTGLAAEAAALLGQRTSPAAGWIRALDGRDPQVRRSAISHLADLADRDAAALAGLRGALESRFVEIRYEAARRLALKGDAAAYETLVTALGDRQDLAIDALVRLGDARTSTALLDRIDDDPAGTADVDRLLSAVGRLRDVAALERVLGHLADKSRRRSAFDAARQLLGYDQYIRLDLDDADEMAADDGRWLAEQHPRQHAEAATLYEAVFGLGDTGLARRLLDDNAKWAPAGALDAALAPFTAIGDDRTRNQALQTYSWRVRHRAADPQPLRDALGHGEPNTRFLAAEGLALAGHADGIEILLSAVDLDPDHSQRTRAVQALGALGDARALDTLLRLVDDEAHVLRDEAAEALGRLSASEHAERIFELLARLAKSDDREVTVHALAGLRWFDTLDGWRIIRDRLSDDDWWIRQVAAEQLAHHDDPDTRRALLDRLREDDDSDVAKAALDSLRKQLGPDALEPDFALARSEHTWLEDRLVERLAGGEAEAIMALLPHIPDHQADELRTPLVAALLGRDPIPAAAAAATLDAPEAGTRGIAARLLGRAGDSSHGPALVTAAAKTMGEWATRHGELSPEARRWDDRLTALTEATRWLLWALGRLATGAEVCIRALDGPDRALRLAAVDALSGGHGGAAGLDALARAVTADDPAVRQAAAGALATLDAARAATLAAQAGDDRRSLVELAEDNPATDETLRAAASRVHAQGIALPLLVARGDVEALSGAAADRALPEAARLGALEALARVADEAAIDAIRAVAEAEDDDEAVRKAAWRARRRAIRARARREGGAR